MRVRAARELGWEEIPVDIEDGLDEATMRKRVLRDNQEYGEWDMDKLANEWEEELKALDLPELDFENIVGFEPDEKDDEVPETPEEPKAKLGDIYQLGKHRVMCGDSTKIEDVKKLMDGKKARLLFSSPPYNMDGGLYENYEDNLKSEEYIEFNIKTVEIWKDFLFGFLFWNISYNKKSRWEFIEILYRIIKETGLKFLELIVWNKKHAMPITSKSMMTRQYEDVLVVSNDEEAGKEEDIEMAGLLRNDKKAFFNRKTGKLLSNYWEIGTNKTQLKNHLACYPVALPVRAIVIMTERGDVISDPFLGSGSTLIACEKTNRVCYGMELDPKYIDVIIKRWEDYTGNKAIKLN